MARGMTLSLAALYDYDETLFEELVLPNDINREDFIENLCLQTYSRDVLYPNPDMMKKAIGFWSRKRINIWNHMVETTQYEYEPLYNIDRYEDITKDHSEMKSSGGDSARHFQGAFDSGELTETQKDRTELDSKHEHDHEFFAHYYGNGGVTMSQQLIEYERRITDYDVMQKIIDEFKDKFILKTYSM